MEFLPKDIENIIMDYKKQLELEEKNEKYRIKKIKKIIYKNKDLIQYYKKRINLCPFCNYYLNDKVIKLEYNNEHLTSKLKRMIITKQF